MKLAKNRHNTILQFNSTISHTHTHTLSHSHTQTHTHTLSHTYTLQNMQTHTLSHKLTQIGGCAILNEPYYRYLSRLKIVTFQLIHILRQF